MEDSKEKKKWDRKFNQSIIEKITKGYEVSLKVLVFYDKTSQFWGKTKRVLIRKVIFVIKIARHGCTLIGFLCVICWATLFVVNFQRSQIFDTFQTLSQLVKDSLD